MDHGDGAVSPWVARWAQLVPAGSAVLDVACGRGRHARFFAARGCVVDAVDRDAEAGAALADADLRFTLADIEAGPWPYRDPDAGPLAGPPGSATPATVAATPADPGPGVIRGRRFDAIVVTNYLHRPLFPALRASLAPGGVLIYETFAAGNAAFGKPSNPAFLLAPGELLALAAGLHVLGYEDGIVARPAPARVQRLCAVALDPTLGTAAPELRARMQL